jgi:hypothetical protein
MNIHKALVVVGWSVAVCATLFYATPRKSDAEEDQRIVFRIERDGVAGVSGYEWTVSPDGHWTQRYFLHSTDAEMTEEVSKGTLTAMENESVRKALKDANFAVMPRELGEAPKVNAERLTLEVGDKKVSVLDSATSGQSKISRQLQTQYDSRKEMTNDKKHFLDALQALENVLQSDR